MVRSPARTHWTLRRPRAGADPFRARGDLRRRGRHEAQSWGRPDPLRMWPHPGGASRGKLGDHPERLLGFHICVRATLERSSHENADPLLLEGGHGLVEIVHLELDMVEALAFLLQEFFVDARTLHRLHQLPTDIAHVGDSEFHGVVLRLAPEGHVGQARWLETVHAPGPDAEDIPEVLHGPLNVFDHQAHLIGLSHGDGWLCHAHCLPPEYRAEYRAGTGAGPRFGCDVVAQSSLVSRKRPYT